MKILVLGASFTGEYLADHFPEHQVWFLSRRAAELAAAGRNIYPETEPEQGAPREAASIGFDAIMDTVPAIPRDPVGATDAQVAADEAAILDPPYHAQIAQLLRDDPGLPYIHISSTSVFPVQVAQASDQFNSGKNETDEKSSAPAAELDEETQVGPVNSRGERRLRLEQKIRELYPHAGILRSTGIYGPGRSIALQFRRSNFRRTTAGNLYVSRIHVHDLVRLFLAMAVRLRANPGDPIVRLVHAVDEKPTANREVFLFLEQELGISVPGEWRDAPARGRIIRSRYARELLADRYQYPTYVEGFRACLEEGDPELSK